MFSTGGRVDHAHHGNRATRAVSDAVALSDAVQRAMDMTSEDDTLIVLTADHSHVLTVAGYPGIDTDIIGESADFDDAAATSCTTLPRDVPHLNLRHHSVVCFVRIRH